MKSLSPSALTGEEAVEAIRNRIPCVKEGWFPDLDADYVAADDKGMLVPFGYPVYPYSRFFQSTAEAETMEGEHSIDYFYAVKGAEEGSYIYQDLERAFAVAYKSRAVGACCRRFISLQAAQEYLAMAELKVFRWGEERFIGFYPDAFAEMNDSSVKGKQLIVLKGERTALYQEQADRRGMSLAQYLIGMAESILEENICVYLVIQIYDKEIQEELRRYMDIRENQAKQYLRNIGYKE